MVMVWALVLVRAAGGKLPPYWKLTAEAVTPNSHRFPTVAARGTSAVTYKPSPDKTLLIPVNCHCLALVWVRLPILMALDSTKAPPPFWYQRVRF